MKGVEQFKASFHFILGGGGLVDLDIVCLNDAKIKVHKVVMAAASSFFRVRINLNLNQRFSNCIYKTMIFSISSAF